MFYDKYLELCKKAGEKPTPVAVSLGVSSSNVAQWKKGSIPRANVLQKIAKHFNVPVSSLLDYLDEKKPTTQSSGELSAELQEIIALYKAASPEVRAAMLAMLRAAEAQSKALDGGTTRQ